jgi:potassium-transporting ATPase ATP-binding subunit
MAMDIAGPTTHDRKAERWQQLFSAPLMMSALKQSFIMLRPDIQWKNPVMFVVEVGAVLTLAFILRAAFGAGGGPFSLSYFIALDIWLWLTVLFANFATAFAEERGRAQADFLRRTRVSTPAKRRRANGTIEDVTSIQLRPGDEVVVTAGEVIPGDGEVIEGVASVDESAITGESAPVVRAAGGFPSRNTMDRFSRLRNHDKRDK